MRKGGTHTTSRTPTLIAYCTRTRVVPGPCPTQRVGYTLATVVLRPRTTDSSTHVCFGYRLFRVVASTVHLGSYTHTPKYSGMHTARYEQRSKRQPLKTVFLLPVYLGYFIPKQQGLDHRPAGLVALSVSPGPVVHLGGAYQRQR